jgi:hypothetical protein
MKGFVYLLEISIALVLMIVVLGTLSSFESKENWERADLISIGNDMEKGLNSNDILDILNNNFTKIQKLKPPNVDFGVEISGISKTNISIGCVQSCDYIKNLTKSLYFNGRWVNFSVGQFSIESLNYIPSYYDAVVFVNYTNYTNRKANITNYLNQGGVVIGINGTFSNTNTDFNDIFGLSPTSSGNGDFNFTAYNPSTDEIEKYFIYLGFNINTSSVIGVKRWGYWYVWETPRKVNITSDSHVDIENKSSDETNLNNIPLGGIFRIKKKTTDTNFYTFKVDSIDWNNNLTIFQPMDVPFTFNDFSEPNAVTGKNFNDISLPSGQAEMTSNNTAIWISDFSWSDEYADLVSYAIATRVKDWYIKSPDLTKEYVAVSSFYPLCCDMPETAKLTIYLWYKI